MWSILIQSFSLFSDIHKYFFFNLKWLPIGHVWIYDYFVAIWKFVRDNTNQPDYFVVSINVSILFNNLPSSQSTLN
jgi:hypothetical protein